MQFRSLKKYLYLIIAGVTIQVLFNITNYYLETKHHDIVEHHNIFVKYINLFLENIALEKDIELHPEAQKLLLHRYENLLKATATYGLGMDTDLIEWRIRYNRELFNHLEKRKELYAKLNELLPSLAKSVSYIHLHHIVYLKNIFDTGTNDTRVKPQVSLPKKEAKLVSELNILSVAISIQNYTLELIEIFSRLQRGISPNEIRSDFDLALSNFFNAASKFEDYSLDAQDGLLVEELILNGNTFEESFKSFLALEQEILKKQNLLSSNRSEFIYDISILKKKNEDHFSQVNTDLETVLLVSLGINITLLPFLLFLAHNMLKGLSKTIAETRKIQKDIQHKIPLQKSDLEEFSFIYTTLNHMSSTVGEKMEELSQTQKLLEYKVEKRTEELSHANTQLQEEIDEKIKNEEHRKQLEEKLNRAEKMEALGTLAGGVAHDLNNILSGIVSYPEILLLDLPADSKMRPPLESIKNSGEKAAVIVQDLLTMTRRGVAKQTIVNLRNVVEEYLVSAEYTASLTPHPGVLVKAEFHGEMTTIKGSKVHLQKTLANLITNGAESITSEGVIEINMTNEYFEKTTSKLDQIKEGEYVKLSVKDSGIGIPQENLDNIFDPFFTTKTMGRSGSGLGMAVVWGTVKDHDGYINVASSPMEGTVFDLYFPLHRSSEELETVDVDLSAFSAKGESVLVVDDVQEQREIATMMLSRLNYAVDTVESGETAIDYLRYRSADILVLDMIMSPGLNGLETYRQILKIHPGQKAIIVSGFSENEQVIEAQKLGTGPYVKKPYTIQELSQAVREELDR